MYAKDYESLINAQCAIIHNAQNYLNDTDYKAIRDAEGGEEETQEEKTARASARVAIENARAEIERLEEERRQEEEEKQDEED